MLPTKYHNERSVKTNEPKELNELRRRWKPDKNAINRIYGCFVNSNKEIITDLDESLGMMTQEEAENTSAC